jgi:hypothetical protein
LIKKTEADQVFEDNGVKIIVDKKSFLYLVGTTLEYSGGLNGKGFVFNNPNAAELVAVESLLVYKNYGKIYRRRFTEDLKTKEYEVDFILILNMKISYWFKRRNHSYDFC